MIDCWFIVRVRVYSWKLKLKWENGGGQDGPQKIIVGRCSWRWTPNLLRSKSAASDIIPFCSEGRKPNHGREGLAWSMQKVLFQRRQLDTQTWLYWPLTTTVLIESMSCVMSHFEHSFIHSFIDWLTDSWIMNWLLIWIWIYNNYYWQDN